MSYLFDGSNDNLTGTFTSTYGDPITLACWIKFTDHPIALDRLITFGNSNSSSNDAYDIRLTATDNQFAAVSTTSAGVSDNAAVVKTGVDATWIPVIGVFTADNDRDIYASDGTGNSVVSRAVSDAVQFIRMGDSMTGTNDFTGRLAECCIWNKALSAGEIASFLAASPPSGIAAANLIGYWPMTSADITNQGVDTGGDLTAGGNAVFDSDHPTISGSSPRRHRTALMGMG